MPAALPSGAQSGVARQRALNIALNRGRREAQTMDVPDLFSRIDLMICQLSQDAKKKWIVPLIFSNRPKD
jgi:hypothetical protein